MIDAFHNLGGVEDGTRFFVDERKSHKGIRVTEAFQQLADSSVATNLIHEVDARWRLVETAWSLGLNVPLIEHDTSSELLFTTAGGIGRVDVTSCRDALNGYQKGHLYLPRFCILTSMEYGIWYWHARNATLANLTWYQAITLPSAFITEMNF